MVVCDEVAPATRAQAHKANLIPANPTYHSYVSNAFLEHPWRG